uniref:General transcription and DNA repair factor IIH subunit TFB5 n=1 Tax=Chaetoceros debilis TaxID=122233 RepID=A0A7S3PU34_9STRA|mmetsp:Transcript_28073/g.43014  ORF Transcript_28073/g.43014 Transcript_28073/m.43014 type:complete len:100 (+) Transcript_28073:144-443(+)
MPPSKQNKAKKARTTKSPKTAAAVPSAGYLLTCDAPTKQFIKTLDESKTNDKKFIIEDLDPTHLLIKGRARAEILRKVEDWMDSNVFTNIERVGENLET